MFLWIPPDGHMAQTHSKCTQDQRHTTQNQAYHPAYGSQFSQLLRLIAFPQHFRFFSWQRRQSWGRILFFRLTSGSQRRAIAMAGSCDGVVDNFDRARSLPFSSYNQPPLLQTHITRSMTNQVDRCPFLVQINQTTTRGLKYPGLKLFLV